MRMSALFDEKNYMVCPHGQGRERVEPVQIRGWGGVCFWRFCANVLYGQPLMLIKNLPNVSKKYKT